MFSQASFANRNLDPKSAESIADTLYEIGADFLKKRQYELSAKWLERSYSILVGQDLEKLSENAGELRYSVMSRLGLQIDSFKLHVPLKLM
jgi:hypothetical protein